MITLQILDDYITILFKKLIKINKKLIKKLELFLINEYKDTESTCKSFYFNNSVSAWIIESIKSL